jgi:hypothetical protein
LRPCVGQIGEHDDGEIIPQITGNIGFEALP